MKGFTLVEILAVIVILGLITGLALFSISNLINDEGGEISDTFKQVLDTANSLYLSSDVNKYPVDNNNVYCVTINNLTDRGLLTTPVIDPVTNDELVGTLYIETVVTDNKFVTVIKEECTPILQLSEMVNGTDFNLAIGSLRSEIDEVIFSSTKSGGYEAATLKWDFSKDTNSEEVLGFIEENNGHKVLHIEASRTIYLTNSSSGEACDPSENSFNGTFCGFTDLKNINFNDSIDTTLMTSMRNMFSYTTSLPTLDLSDFNTSNIVNMSRMFNNATNLQTINFGTNFDTSNVVDMSVMFSTMSSIKELDLSFFNTSSVTTMNNMFSKMSSLNYIDLSSFDTSKVINMNYMFSNNSSLIELDITNFNTASTTSMISTFNGMSSIKILDLSSFDTSKVTTMSAMFHNMSDLENLIISEKFKGTVLTDSSLMFFNTTSLEQLDLSNFISSTIVDANKMFQNSSIAELDLSGIDFSKATNLDSMFSFSKATLGYAKDTANATILNGTSSKPATLNFAVN